MLWLLTPAPWVSSHVGYGSFDEAETRAPTTPHADRVVDANARAPTRRTPDAPGGATTGGRVGTSPGIAGGRPASPQLWTARLAGVSGLWTPDGEHLVGAGDGDDELESDIRSDEELTAQAQAVEAELAEARKRLAEVPVELVIVNHAMGIYELGAIHLSSQPPDLNGAALAIDAFACLVEGLDERLGPELATLRDALSQIRLAFVQIKGAQGSS